MNELAANKTGRMKLSPLAGYKQIAEKKIAKGAAIAWISHSVADPQWDEFLQSTSLGQFQQSAMWAQAKTAEGWKVARVVLTLDDEICGGFQMIWRSSWRGRMGYVSKGPVVSPAVPELLDFAANQLTRTARSERLRILVVQSPDLCDQFSPRLVANGFELDVLAGVNDCTWTIDLRNGFPAVEEQMSKWTRKKIRQAVNRGVTVREGTREDVGKFFQLMLTTCRRHGVEPSPPEEKAMLALWDAAATAKAIRLTFAEHRGKELAGLVSVSFGGTVSLWKKGWISSEAQLHPNELLMDESLRWACARGYRVADFCAFDKQMAATILSGQPLSAEQEKSRHAFNVRLGGRPLMLPKAMTYLPNRVFRSAYRSVFRKKLRHASQA